MANADDPEAVVVLILAQSFFSPFNQLLLAVYDQMPLMGRNFELT